MARIITAGLLVGAGTGMGNGCTSGHGICGVSRFSVRSMAYTGLFMASGFACATAFATNAALGVDSSYAALSHVAIPAAETLTRYDAKLAVGGLMFGAGWGLAGLCPGPAIVSAAARPTGKLLAWLGAVAVGMFAQSRAVR